MCSNPPCDHHISYSLQDIQKVLFAVSDRFYLSSLNEKLQEQPPGHDLIFKKLEDANGMLNVVLEQYDKTQLFNCVENIENRTEEELVEEIALSVYPSEYSYPAGETAPDEKIQFNDELSQEMRKFVMRLLKKGIPTSSIIKTFKLRSYQLKDLEKERGWTVAHSMKNYDPELEEKMFLTLIQEFIPGSVISSQTILSLAKKLSNGGCYFLKKGQVKAFVKKYNLSERNLIKWGNRILSSS